MPQYKFFTSGFDREQAPEFDGMFFDGQTREMKQTSMVNDCLRAGTAKEVINEIEVLDPGTLQEPQIPQEPQAKTKK